MTHEISIGVKEKKNGSDDEWLSSDTSRERKNGIYGYLLFLVRHKPLL